MSTLNFLNAVKTAASTPTKPSSQPQYAPKKEEPPPPAAVPDEEEEDAPVNDQALEEFDDVPAEESQPIVRSGNNKKYAGPLFSILEFADDEKESEFWMFFAEVVGPVGLINFGLTCTYLFDKVMSSELWGVVQPQLLPVINPTVNFMIETAVENAGVEKLYTVNVTSIKQNYQIQHLVAYWLRIISKAEAEREDAKSDDPTAKQQTLNAVLKGGFSIESGSAKNSQTIFYLQDLSLVSSVVNAIDQLISRVHRSVKIPYRNSNIVLALYGRGGNCVSLRVTVGKEHIFSIFPLDEFANQIRKAAKKFIPLAGSCRMQIYKIRKSIPSEELKPFLEKSAWLEKLLAHEKLHQAAQQIRSKLAHGVIPGSELPEHFQKKKISNKQKQDQVDIENGNIMDLIIENLPEHWDEAKAAARNLEIAIKEQRVNEKEDRKARKDKERAERDRLRDEAEQAKLKIEVLQDESLEAAAVSPVTKKPKTHLKTTKDENGWVKQKRVFDDDEGNEVEVKPQVEEKVKAKKVKAEQPNPNAGLNNNIFVMADESESLPSIADYQKSLREAKVKGKQEKTPAKPKPVRKPAEDKEKEKEKEKKIK